MTTPNFETKLVIDDRLNVQGKKIFGVQRGGVDVTTIKYEAQTKSPSSVAWNINPPSLNTIVSRSSRLNTRLTFEVSKVGAGALPNGGFLFNYGIDFAVCAGGFQAMVSQSTLQLNNVSVNLNYEDVYKPILRCLSKEEKAKYLQQAPIMDDTFVNLLQGFNTPNNAISAYGNSSAFSKYQPRGSFRPVASSVNPLVAGDGAGAGTTSVQLTFDFSENLFMSPFVFGDATETSEGLFGINNMQLTMNLSSILINKFFNHILGSSVGGVISNRKVQVSLVSVDKAELELLYITPPPTMALPLSSQVRYFDMPRFITQTAAIPAGAVASSRPSSTITLPNIPDKLLIYARTPVSSFAQEDRTIVVDRFLPITKISLNWGNKSSLLANMSTEELYAMSVRNGLQMSYVDWLGRAYRGQVGGDILAGDTYTTGGFLLIDTKDIGLPLDQASGEVAQLTIQCNVDIFNNYNAQVPCEIVIIPISCGLFVSEGGQSSVHLGLLNRTMVVDALDGKSEVMSSGDVQRMIGSGFWDKFKSTMDKALPYVKTGLKSVNDPRAQALAGVLESAGYGMSAGRKRLN
jgi:hypothetical protein